MTKFKAQNKFGICFIIYVLSFVVFPRYAFTQPVSSSDLINNAKLYDGKTVVYEGEVIGEIMPRGDFAWINVNDGQNALGIWLPRSLARNILYAGSYKAKGDWVQISGTLHRACFEHGGDLDIHAQELRRVSTGRLLVERLNTSKRDLVLVLFVILGIVWILKRLTIR